MITVRPQRPFTISSAYLDSYAPKCMICLLQSGPAHSENNLLLRVCWNKLAAKYTLLFAHAISYSDVKANFEGGLSALINLYTG